MDKQYLRSLMALHKDNNSTLSEYLGMSKATVSYKINEKKNYAFDKAEMEAIRDKYDLNNDDFIKLFFNKKVS